MSQGTAPEAPEKVAVPCPRCRKPLVDPNGLGWCKACGYCKSLAESEAQTAQPAKAELNTVTATGSALMQTPIWLWIALFGMAVIVGATMYVSRQWTLTPFQRALFTSLQIGAGVAIMFVGQFMGLMRMAPDDPSLGIKDAFIPLRLYGLIFKRLPQTRYTVYLGLWGITAIICAASLIGGLGHWFSYLPNAKKTPYVIEKVK